MAGECADDLDLTMPFLIDNMKDEAQQAYAGWPDRIYIVDKEFKVAFQGEPGPRGFSTKDAEDALKKLLKK